MFVLRIYDGVPLFSIVRYRPRRCHARVETTSYNPVPLLFAKGPSTQSSKKGYES
jgi:hypothetical protein